MFRLLILVSLCLTCGFSAESALGGITLGDKLETVAVKYPYLSNWKKFEATSSPYPLFLTKKEIVYLAQSPRLDLQCYFNEKKEVTAVSVFLNNSRSEDKNIYETSEGLRPGDGPIELKLLYGLPQDMSEYTYKDPSGKIISRRLYYYPQMCIQSRQYAGLPEVIDIILIGKYAMTAVIQDKDIPIPPQK